MAQGSPPARLLMPHVRHKNPRSGRLLESSQGLSMRWQHHQLRIHWAHVFCH